jgi:hypothetical protein
LMRTTEAVIHVIARTAVSCFSVSFFYTGARVAEKNRPCPALRYIIKKCLCALN